MIHRLLFFVLFLTVTSSAVGQSLVNAGNTEAARILVQHLQQLPQEEIFCSVKNWETGENGAPEILKPKFEKFWGKEMLSLFFWFIRLSCGSWQPDIG